MNSLTLHSPVKNFRNSSREEIEDLIFTRANSRVDMIKNTSSIMTQIEGPDEGNDLVYLINHNGIYEPIEFNDLAFSQLLSRCGIPVGFYNKNPIHLQNEIFNYWATKTKQDLLFRYHIFVNGSIVRGVLSQGYETIDDDQVFPLILATLDSENINVINTHFGYDEKITQLVVKFTDMEREYNGIKLSAGLMVTNSEVGQSSVWIEPVVFHGQSNIVNRASLNKQKLDMRIIHRGNIVPSKIIDMALNMRNIAQAGMVQFAEAWEKRVSGEQALSFAKNISALPSRMYKILEEEWSEQRDISRAEVTLKIMELAQSLPLFQRSQVEQESSAITGVFSNYKDRMMKIMIEID